MAFIHDQSCECSKSELDLFSVPPTETSMEQSAWVEYHPLTTVADGSPIEFDISGGGQDYIDFANTMLHVKAKIVKPNGNALVADDAVGPVNLFLHSLFSQVDVALNGTLVTSSTNTYPYRAYLESLLSYGEDAKKSQLTSELYYKDTASKMDSLSLDDADVNHGMLKRRAYTTESHVVEMLGRIHADMFFQERYILNEADVRIKLTRSANAFCVMGDGKVIITHASLFVRKVRLMPSVFMAHAKTLEKSTAKYPIRRVVCKTFTVPRGYLDLTHEKLFSGQLPTRVIIGLVENAAFNGARDKNPFNFQNFDVSELSLYLDGQQQHAIKPFQPSFADGQFMRPYISLFSGSGKLFADEGIDVARDDYANGYALYAFNLTPDLGGDEHFNLVREGNVRLQMKFGTALPATVTTIVYAEFENIIELDRNRNVIYDFTI